MARKIAGMSQFDFGNEIGKSQSVVSKYEKGLADPPPEVVSHCMTIVMRHHGIEDVSFEQIIQKLRRAKSLPTAPCLYQAIDVLIDSFALSANIKAHPSRTS